MQGYIHPGYADSLMEFGTPHSLPLSRGCILKRQIPGTSLHDAMGCYPLFCCKNWAGFYEDIQALGQDRGLVSLSLVADPFGGQQLADLKRCFDVVIPFKEHYVADLQRPLDEIVSKRHSRKVRRALRTVQVNACVQPYELLNEWVELYRNLIDRHGITGIKAFSEEAFIKQLSLPGTYMLRASLDGVTIGAKIYYLQGDVVHCHLGAVSPKGYEVGAFFALDCFALEYFADKARWHNLGGGSGFSNECNDGLCRYKRGWATETRTCYFCGKIFDERSYAELISNKVIAPTTYFPAYRKGEFG